jgi:hypothetical protein
MKFSTVRIQPGYGGWVVYFYDLKLDRRNDPTVPHPAGFYNYPCKLGKKKAFKALQARMVQAHEEEIARLTGSLNKLKELKCTS